MKAKLMKKSNSGSLRATATTNAESKLFAKIKTLRSQRSTLGNQIKLLKDQLKVQESH
jgi:hypothetical protein